MRRLAGYVGVVAMLAAVGFWGMRGSGVRPGPSSLGAQEGVTLITGRQITPQGTQTGVGSFPCNLALSPDGRFVVVTNSGYRQSLSVLSTEDGRLLSQIACNGSRPGGKQALFYGLAFGRGADGGTLLYVSRGVEDRVAVYTLDGEGKLTETEKSLANPAGAPAPKPLRQVAGLALSRDGGRLYAASNLTDTSTGLKGGLAILNTATGEASRVPVPGFPFAVAALTAGPGADTKVYVSSERDGTVSVVDPGAARVVGGIPTGDHPMALLLDRAQSRLFVANAGSDTVSVLDTATDRVTQTILLRPDDVRGLAGTTPTGLALSPDERRLYVTLADMNAVAVVNLPQGELSGYLPVGWYPTAVVATPDGKRLLVANAKGVEGRNPNGKAAGPGGAWGKYIENIIEGTVSCVTLPDEAGLKRLSAQAIVNSRVRPDLDRAARAILPQTGIEHVIYILKENRTYDQVLGDLPQGNGDPSLCLFPREVTPNLHALAERFVLMDNFHCCAEVSADGWTWSCGGMASEYVSRNAPYQYGGRSRTYDFEGSNGKVPVDLYGIPDVNRPAGGYLWDLVAAKGLSYRNYGFYVTDGDGEVELPEGKREWKRNQASKKALEGHTDEEFLRFDMRYADSDAWVIQDAATSGQMKQYGKYGATSRFAEWKREFDQYVKEGNLPRFLMVRLPRDHTAGTTAGLHSPRAMVADNDYAVGRLVEEVSKSPYWKKTAIFIMEDDAQNGFDHVDAHRSTCYVISPYVQKGSVDHRFYNTDSVLRTMELLMGLPPLCQYDAIAAPVGVFAAAPENDAPYAAILPERRILAEASSPRDYRAADSARLNFRTADSVPDAELNDILWHALRGRQTPKPAIRRGLRVAAGPRK